MVVIIYLSFCELSSAQFGGVAVFIVIFYPFKRMYSNNSSSHLITSYICAIYVYAI